MTNIEELYLTKNVYSRPGLLRDSTLGIVVHWFGNPNQTAEECRDYFESLKDGKKETYGSAQYIVGLKGEVIQTMDVMEVARHAGSQTKDPYSGKIYTDMCRKQLTSSNPNFCTIGVEHAHLDWQGTMTDETLYASAQLVAELCVRFNLNPWLQVFTHKELVGWKNCHMWFVNHPKDWEEYKGLVEALVKTYRT